MGVFLIASKKSGVSFERSITIGRQSINFGLGSLEAALKRADIDAPQDVLRSVFEGDGFAEPFLKLLGAQLAESIDNSSYENATYVADLNWPLNVSLRGRYSAVVDSGSTEHVFNYPQAIKTCMEMVEVGGHYLGIVPINNLAGHGFYQFSPELAYRVFSPENGFEVERVYVALQEPGAEWLKAPDPAAIQKRVEYRSSKPAYLYIRARKVADVEIFRTYPQQSDYVAHWAQGTGDAGRRSGQPAGRLSTIIGKLPDPVKRILGALRYYQARQNETLSKVNIYAD